MQSTAKKAALPAITLAALGVVFGDIGTSPLYAFKECFHATHGLAINEANVLGILSLICWALLLMVSYKYVGFIMRANNNGEGGIMALLALNMRSKQLSNRSRRILVAIGLFGAALFFGDGIIAPAVSVLSAVEGLSIATPIFDPYIVPITMAVLVGLFLIQRKGTGSVGRFFGPVMLLWFLSLGGLGLYGIVQQPDILRMINPYWAIHFVLDHPAGAFLTMGAVVLTITGGEALYADMGHFGRQPIQLGWFIVALPCLLLNYAGQGAMVLHNPAAAENPFFNLVPEWVLYPMIVLATMATVIASQAVISGVFSIARQAMQLGYLPRLSVHHTSESEIGQIYVPFLNWLLLGSILLLVAAAKSSSNLAAAYGLAVTLTMICDTLLVTFVLINIWRWNKIRISLMVLPILALDLTFFSATSLKILAGGWIPLLVGALAFIVMMTWKRGREILYRYLEKDTLPIELFIQSIQIGSGTQFVAGQAVFLTGTPNIVPHAMLHNIKHNKVLHERNILVTVITLDIPYVDQEEHIQIEKLSEHFYRIHVYYGFKDQPDIPAALQQAYAEWGFEYDLMQISFFISRERIMQSVGEGMASWREKLFISMQRNTSPVSDFYQIPTNRVVELGSQIEI